MSDLFSDDVKMTGQDKKTTEGKTQVLRRLNKGMESFCLHLGQSLHVLHLGSLTIQRAFAKHQISGIDNLYPKYHIE